MWLESDKPAYKTLVKQYKREKDRAPTVESFIK